MKEKNYMNSDDVEIFDKETPFSGYFSIDRYHLRHRQFAGGMGPKFSREIFERGHAASVLMYDPGMDLLVFIYLPLEKIFATFGNFIFHYNRRRKKSGILILLGASRPRTPALLDSAWTPGPLEPFD